MGEGHFDEASDKEVGIFFSTSSPSYESIARHHVPEPAEHVDWENLLFLRHCNLQRDWSVTVSYFSAMVVPLHFMSFLGRPIDMCVDSPVDG